MFNIGGFGQHQPLYVLLVILHLSVVIFVVIFVVILSVVNICFYMSFYDIKQILPLSLYREFQ